MKHGSLALGLVASVAVAGLAPSAAHGQAPGPNNIQPFQQGRSATLSDVAMYRLRSMGHHVHLSPALRWRLGRTPYTQYSPAKPNSSAATRSTVSGASAYYPTYYPTAARVQPQKPFANVRPAPTAFERYWPLLLEGREDPKTGIIIWSLP